MRTFKIEMAVTLVADNVEDISQEVLAQFIAEAVRIDVKKSSHSDGPVNGGFVQFDPTLLFTKPPFKLLLTAQSNCN